MLTEDVRQRGECAPWIVGGQVLADCLGAFGSLVQLVRAQVFEARCSRFESGGGRCSFIFG